jgi:hypothetical protein
MSNTAPTAAAPKSEPKEKEAPATHPKAEKAEHEAKPKEKAAHETDDSDDSSDSEDEKDPEKREKKKAKKAEKAKDASAKGGKPKKEKDAGSRPHIQTVGRQEHTDHVQQESTLTRNTTQTSLPALLVCSVQHPCPSLLHHLTINTTSNRILSSATTASFRTNYFAPLTPTRPQRPIESRTCRYRYPGRRRHVFHHRICFSDACSSKDFYRSLGPGCGRRSSGFRAAVASGRAES